MSYIATDISSIPEGFAWYIFFLEDQWIDDFRREFYENFVPFGNQGGREILVVRGADPEKFYRDVYDKYFLYTESWKENYSRPALLITDVPPRTVGEGREARERVRKIVIPLAPHYKGSSSVSNLLRELSTKISTPDAMTALEVVNKLEIRRWWCHLITYFELKPNFAGWGVNLNQILEDICEL